jgi:hypothetical protein
MKKLSVLLLATVFVFGLVVQAGAQVTDGVDAGDQLIDFLYDAEGQLIGPCGAAIAEYKWDAYGVSFSDNLYPEIFFSRFTFGSPEPVSNFSTCPFDPSSEGQPVIVTFDPPVTHVEFIGVSPNFDEGGITVTPFRDDAAGTPVFFKTPPGGATSISIMDPLGIDMIQIEGNGYYAGAQFIFWIDDLTFGGSVDTVTRVKVNIKPPDCLGARIAMDEKRINGKSKGVTPVVIMGDETYDVTAINPEKVLLQGVEPVRWALEDAVHCNAEYGDGMLDLTLKFNTQQLVQAMRDSLDAEDLKDLEDGMPVSLNLNLTGELYDGTPIESDGDLRVTIVMKGKHQHENRGRGNMHPEHDRGHHKGWHNNRGHHKGWKNHHGWD